MDTRDLDAVVRHYLVTALWSSNNDDIDPEGYGHPLDEDYDVDDVADETVEHSRTLIEAFVESNRDDVLAYVAAFGNDWSQLGHDFWLTRNGHGAGFWDRGLGEVGDRLSDASSPYGEAYAYVGHDDGLVHIA